MPTPNRGETQRQFINRCINSEESKKTFPKLDQRVAFCYSVWREHNKKKEEQRYNLKRLTYKKFGKDFKKFQDQEIPKSYRIVKGVFNDHLRYFNKLLLETKDTSRMLSRVNKNKLADDYTEMLRKIHTKVGIDTNNFIKKYVKVEKYLSWGISQTFIDRFLTGLIYQMNHRGQQIANTTVNELTNILHQ